MLEHPPQLGMHKIKYSLNYNRALGTYLIHPCITLLTAKFTKLEHWREVYVSTQNSEVQTKTHPPFPFFCASAFTGQCTTTTSCLRFLWVGSVDGFLPELVIETTVSSSSCSAVLFFKDIRHLLFVVVFSCFMEKFFLLLWSYNLLWSILYRIINT